MNENDQKAHLHNRILVGLDLTETGDRAFTEGLALARQLPNCELHIGHVIAGSGHNAKHLGRAADELRTKLVDARTRTAELCALPWVGPSCTLPIVFHIRLGDPAEALHQLAVDVDATLIVVGTRAHTGLQKLLLGSVADVLTRTAHLSVLVAHPKSFSGLSRTATIDPAQPGEIHPTATGITQRLHFHFELPDRKVHISGLI
jgi:nucleotide-binding universal stress UspA family protein